MIPELFTAGKTLKNIYDFSKKASNYFLIKKIEAFNEKPQSEESKKFWNDLKQDFQKFEEVVEQLIHSLTSAESAVKARYIRNLIDAYSEGKVDWLTFCRLNFILNQIYTFDLEKVVEFYHGNKSKLEKNEEERFFTLGLLNHKSNYFSGNESVTKKDLENLETKYEKNDLGQLFVDCVLFEEKKRIAERHREDVNKSWNGYSRVMTDLLTKKNRAKIY